MKRKILSVGVLLVSILVLSVVAVVPVASASPSSALDDDIKMSAELVNEPVALETSQGPSGSGWKPDVIVANHVDDEIDPSMGSYIDPVTGAVTLYVVYRRWHPSTPYGARWEGWIARSTDRGATWGWWWHFWWDAAIGFSTLSLGVNAYNNTVFVAEESYPIAGGNHRIDIARFTATFEWHPVDTSGDNRNPALAVEYSFGLYNYLYISYEKWASSDDRDLYFASSTDWGKTWTTQLLRGGAVDTGVYAQSSITYAQRNVYIAYRHSTDYATIGHIDVAYSTNYGGTWNFATDVSEVANDASWPSIAGSHFGSSHEPTTVIVAYEYEYSATDHDIYYTFSVDYGATWAGGSDVYHRIADTVVMERRPKLAIDGTGTESMNVGGNYHLVYWKSNALYYTQLPYFDVPIYYGGHVFWGYYFGWTSPHGQVTDTAAVVTMLGCPLTITAYTKTVAGVSLWEPGIAWLDDRNFSTQMGNIYYSTPGTDFSITFVPSSQSVVAGKSVSYYVTVNLLTGTTATAYLGSSTAHWPQYMSVYVTWDWSATAITPTATSTLTIHTSNLCPPGTYQFSAAAVIGGYRRWVYIPYTVTAPPKLTLSISPTTVARGSPVTISGALTPWTPGLPTTAYLYYRFPHQTGSWALATTLTLSGTGTFSITATVPMGLTPGQYDLVAFWVNTANGSYATSPIKVLTIT